MITAALLEAFHGIDETRLTGLQKSILVNWRLIEAFLLAAIANAFKMEYEYVREETDAPARITYIRPRRSLGLLQFCPLPDNFGLKAEFSHWQSSVSTKDFTSSVLSRTRVLLYRAFISSMSPAAPYVLIKPQPKTFRFDGRTVLAQTDGRQILAYLKVVAEWTSGLDPVFEPASYTDRIFSDLHEFGYCGRRGASQLEPVKLYEDYPVLS